MSQRFNTVDVLRLRIEEDAAGLANLVTNPSGDRGASGWLSPVPGASLESYLVPFVGVQALRFYSVVGVANYFTTEPVPMTAGSYYRARWAIPSGTGTYYRVKVEHIGADDQIISAATLTGWLIDTTVGPAAPAAVQAPAGTVAVRVRYDHAATNAGGNFSSPEALYVRDVTLASATTSAALNGLPLLPTTPLTSITGSANHVSINRNELDLGTLSVDLVDADLDPAKGSIIRPGKRVEVQVSVAGVWSNLFEGRVSNGATTYDFTKPLGSRVRVKLTATDAVTQLANRRRPEGVATVDELPYVLEGTGVPWLINGYNGQVGGATVVAVNESATAIDQVAITRDTTLGYAWVNRDGVLVANDPAHASTTPAAVLAESTYRDPDFGFDSDRCINEVSIIVVSTVAGETTETTFGPFRDVASIDKWGRHAETFTVYDKTEADVKAHAISILAANSTPVMRCASVVMPIATLADLPKTIIDLYDVVTVQNGVAELDDDLRVVGVSHDISPTKWMVTLTFAGVGAVAPSQVVPSPSLSPLNLEGIGNTVMAYGTAAQVVANNPGHLIMDGSAYGGAAAYPKLHAHLTAMVAAGVHTDATLLPNMTDRFPIAAGTKAVGSSGGSATNALVTGNLPDSIHLFATGGAGGGTSANGGLTVAQGATTGRFNHPVSVGVGGTTSAPFSIMPPWRALYFLIRAA